MPVSRLGRRDPQRDLASRITRSIYPTRCWKIAAYSSELRLPCMHTLGILANPASGKDVRRLVARASVFDNQEKNAIVRRVLLGASNAGVRAIRYFDDSHGITRNALDEVATSVSLDAEAVEATDTRTTLDTISAARALMEIGCGAVVTLGGDGTNRAFSLGWQDAVLAPLSTGTNNVFPVLAEATVAGAAAGLVASGAVSADDASNRHKAIHVHIDGESDDIALIDAVLTRDRFVGARALLSPDDLALALLTRADPAAVGMTSIGGLLQPMTDADDGGLLLEMRADGVTVNAPIAPGFYRHVTVGRHVAVDFGDPVSVSGPGVLAFDGERERVLKPGQRATLIVARDGPRVIDIPRVMALASERGYYRR